MRRAALYAASRVIVSLHPSQVVSAVTATDSSIATGLEWIREWALGIADNDPDGDCSTVCLTPLSSISNTHLFYRDLRGTSHKA